MGELFGSPLLHEGFLFNATGKAELFSFDLKGKGELKPQIDGQIIIGDGSANAPIAYSSLTLAGKYIFYSSNAGETVVMEATREAKDVAKNQLNTGSGSSPVFSGTDMFIRSRDKLFCVGPKP